MMPYSGDRRRSPPPQPYATFSYLSPSAAPFTVDRPRATPDPIPNAPNPSPYPDLPTAPSLYESWVDPPSSYMAPVAPAAAPGYAGFANSDGFLVAESAPRDIYSENHFGTSMQMQLHPFTTGSSEWMEEKYPGIYQRSSKALSSDFGSSVAHQPSLPSSMLDCLDKKPCPIPQPVKSVNHYSAYSAYDNYMSHLPSCSTYPLNYDLSIPSVAASPEVCAVTTTAPSTTDCHVLENAFSSPYMNPCRINLDYFDTMQNDQKDLVGYQTAYKHYGDWSSSVNGMIIMGNYPLSSLGVGENYHAGESSGTGRPVQLSSEGKSDLKSSQASCSKVSLSELAFAQPGNLFTESLEVNNPVVDSPCWKGTPTVHQPSFGIVKNDEDPHSANGSVDLHGSHQGKKLSEFSTKNAGLFSKHYDTSNPENDPSLPYCMNYLSAFSLPLECKKSEGHNDTQSSIVGACNGTANHPSYVSVEQGTRREKHMTCKLGDDSENVVTPGQQGSGFPFNKTNESTVLGGNIGSHVGSMSEESVNKFPSHIDSAPTAQARSLTKESLHENTSYYVHKAAATRENLRSEKPMNRCQEHLSHCNPGVEEVEEDIVKISSDKVTCRSKTQAEFIKSMYNLSVTLLSTCNGGCELEESDRALIQSAIQNLSSLSPKRRKAALKVDDVNSNCCQSKLEKMWCNGNTCQPEKFAELDSGNIGTDFKTFILQDLTKLPEENKVGDTKDAQMMVYKNLWIEAEASMCKLKYELQLARMKLAMKCHNQQTGAVPTDSSGEDKASNLPKSENSLCIGVHDDSSEQQNHVKVSNICSATFLPQGGYSCGEQFPVVNRSVTDQIAAAVFARLKALKSRDNNINSFHEDNSEQQQETSNNRKTDGVDDAVTNNVSISKCGDDSINSLVEDFIKERLEASKIKGDEADVAITATQDFMTCNNNTSSLDEDINQELPEANENIADGAVMARLKDLTCCNDNISSSGEDNANRRQTASNNEFGQLEDGVMARLQVLKRRIDNTSSIVDGGQEVFHSDGHFERKQFGSADPSGAHDWLIEKTDLPDDVKCTTPSDEVNGKTSVQHLSTLLKEYHVFSAPVEPASLHMHDEQLSDEVNAKTSVQHLSTLLKESHVFSAPVEPASLQLHGEQLSYSPSEWEHVLKEDFFHPGNTSK